MAAIWLEKVVTPLIDPAIKGFAAAPAVLKLERLKVDKTRVICVGYGMWFSKSKMEWGRGVKEKALNWNKKNTASDISIIPVWVKLHGVPVTAFSEDGLSVIATKLGNPLMLDSYTSDMCMQSWGREGHHACNVRVEYEWKPPRCSFCKVFGHMHEECSKNTGVGEKIKMKKPSQTFRGVPVDISIIPVWVKLHGVPVTAFSEDGLSVIATKLGNPLMLDSYTSDMCMQSWGREGHHACNVRVEYEWKPPRCSFCKVFGHMHEECSKNTGVGEKIKMKKPSQTFRGVPVGLKMSFKPHKEYRLVPKKSPANSSCNKKE
nr:hypothetical protein [Tanacetum cinerariifolium]